VKAQAIQFAIQNLQVEDKFVPAGPAAPGMTTQDQRYYIVKLRVANWDKSSDRAVVRVVFDGHTQKEFNLNRSTGINYAQTAFEGRVDYTLPAFGQSGFTQTMIIRLFKNTNEPQNLIESQEIKKPNVTASEQEKEQASQSPRLTAARAETSNTGVDIHWQLSGIPKANAGYKILITQDSKTIAQYNNVSIDVQTAHVKGKQDDTFTVILRNATDATIDSLTVKAGLPGTTSLTTPEDKSNESDKNNIKTEDCSKYLGFSIIGGIRFEPGKYIACQMMSFVGSVANYVGKLVENVRI
jgi:hypothetical protein